MKQLLLISLLKKYSMSMTVIRLCAKALLLLFSFSCHYLDHLDWQVKDTDLHTAVSQRPPSREGNEGAYNTQYIDDTILQESKLLVCEILSDKYFFLYKGKDKYEPQQMGIKKQNGRKVDTLMYRVRPPGCCWKFNSDFNCSCRGKSDTVCLKLSQQVWKMFQSMLSFEVPCFKKCECLPLTSYRHLNEYNSQAHYLFFFAVLSSSTSC